MSAARNSGSFEIVGSTLAGLLEPAVAIAASRAGATGLLNLEHVSDLDRARSAVARLVTFGRGSLGVKVAGPSATGAFVRELPATVTTVVLAAADGEAAAGVIEEACAGGRRILCECTTVEQGRAAAARGAVGLIAKGHEAGGYVGEETTFILVQRLLQERLGPVFAAGGMGPGAAAACYAAGCDGVVMETPLALARESRLPGRLRAALERMEGDETLCLGGEAGALFRVYQRPGMSAAEALRRFETTLAGDPPAAASARWRAAVEERVGWDRPDEQLWPLGQDGAFASRLARRFLTVSGIIAAVREAVQRDVELARAQRALHPGAPLARAHGTEYPVLQGPMTRVSDTAAFADAVARGGALPFLALALLRKEQVHALLQQTSERLGTRPWGVGILGFVPLELREEQLEVVQQHRPRFAIIAGGRPDQAARLEDGGIATYLHVPAPGLLRSFLQDGARRFIFEGRECGGHVGPRTSFVLWQAVVDALLDAVDGGVAAEELHVVFAGGIHDERSAAMAATLAAPLVERGARIGVLLGTAYLFTEEAVAAGAIVEGFQREAVDCAETVLLETGPGHSTRCVRTPFYETFRETRRRLVEGGKTAEELRSELEALNLGRLRIAAKGIARDGPATGSPRYVEVEPERQRSEGMFMIGQLAALRRGVGRMADLHENVCAGSTRLLEERQGPARPARTSLPAARPCDVAIVGLGCLLPKAPDVASFWANVLGKVDAITEVPKSRFDVELYFDADRQARDKIYSRWGGFLDDVPFDPMRYGIPPAALRSIDSLQLLALEAARQALANAGYLDRDFARDRTAVILGLSGGLGDLGLGYGVRASLPQLGNVPAEALERLPEWTEDSFAGILLNVAAGRVANRFDLGGVNYTVDAACASSLAAVYLAVSELDGGSADMVLVGGVDTVQSPFGFLCFSKSHALSPRGRCRTFDATADGITISEGVTMLVLKRLADAERDGDRIYAVIKGVAGSSDGRGRSLTAPRPEGQTLALERAYARAGISPSTVGLLEAHGTGTVVGDAAEVAALSDVFLSAGAPPASCAIGSVKSAIGHTKSAAGVTGLMKAALALHHRVLPPTLHVESPNPRLREARSPFFVSTEARPWLCAEPAAPRRAGVSSFGFGGTNFHVVLEEHAGDWTDPLERMASPAWPAELFTWRAASAPALDAALAALATALEQGARPTLRALAAAVNAAAEASSAGALHLAIVATDIDVLKARLGAARDALAAGRTEFHDPAGLHLGGTRRGKLAFLFPGQGSQSPHMLRDLAVHLPHVRLACERADRVLACRLAGPLSRYVYPPPSFTPAEEAERMRSLTDTQVAQPALGALEAGLLHLLRDVGVEPDMVAGHSYGEYVALHAAGVIREDALFEISEARGRAIKDSVGHAPGTMAAVQAGANEVASVLHDLPGVWLANFNTPRQTILSGAPADLERATALLASAGLRSQPIPVACAFHSPLMEGARARLAGDLGRLDLQRPRVAVFSNTTGGPYPADPSLITALLADHLVKPVRFVDEVRAMHEQGARIFVEVGPKAVLTGLVRQILDRREVLTVPLDAPDRHGLLGLLGALAQLTAAGVPLRLPRLFAGRVEEPVDLDHLELTRPREHAWVVSGAGARAVGEPAGRLAPAAAQPAASWRAAAVPPAPAVVPAPSAGDIALPSAVLPVAAAAAAAGDPIVQQFQSLMSEFLQAQTAVITAYLQGGGVLSAVPLSAPAPVAAVPVVAAPSPPPARVEPATPVATGGVIAELVRIVAGRTGYPAEMIDAGANLEADLGIDSIKRVEILSAFQRSRSSEEQRRLQGAMDRLTAGKTLRAMAQVVEEALGLTAGAAPPPPPPATGATVRDLEAELLRLVGERTGYPRDMLGLDLGIEADLGIDSIKRVEILSAFQRNQPADDQARVQQVMDRLTTRKTLREMIAALEDALSGAAEAPSAAPARAASDELVPRLTLAAIGAPLEPASARAFPGRVWLITDDEGGVAEAVASGLGRRGERPVLLRHSAAMCERGPALYEADLTRADQIAAVVDRVSAAVGRPAAVLHLLALKDGPSFDELTLEGWRARVQADVKTLYGLVRAVADDATVAGGPGGAMIVAATGLGPALAGAADDAFPTHGGVAALLKTVAAELPQVACRAVHLDASRSSTDKVASLLDEAGALAGPLEVGYVAGRRLTVVPRLARLEPASNGTHIGGDWVFLLTGGARGITAEIATYLASTFAPTLVLAGLSPLPDDEPPELAALTDAAQLKAALTASMRAQNPAVRPAEVDGAWQRLVRNREIRRNLEALRRTGARVEYHSVDGRDEIAFGALIDGVYERHGRLDGVIHGAGIIEDKLLRDKTAESFDRVVHTKADSAFTLVKRLRPAGLKLLIFMSSVTATFGNRGQADYGAANGILNALATLLAARWPGRVRAVNWGPWDKTGMVSEEVKHQFASRGIQVIPAPAGVAALAREIEASVAREPVVVVGGGPWVGEATRLLAASAPTANTAELAVRA